jgi:hypothetical protein
LCEENRLRQNVSQLDGSEHVKRILLAAVKAASEAYSAATYEFWRICSEQTDRERQTIREATAAARQSLTREEMIAALVRLNRFFLDGTIPEELKYLSAPKGRAMSASA